MSQTWISYIKIYNYIYFWFIYIDGCLFLPNDRCTDKSVQSRIATKLAGRKLEVLLLGRQALHELRHFTSAEDVPIFNETNYISLDLSDSKSGEMVKARLGELDVKSVELLIHNAAAGYYEHAVDLIQTKYAVCELRGLRWTSLLLPESTSFPSSRTIYVWAHVCSLISPIQITRSLFESMALVAKSSSWARWRLDCLRRISCFIQPRKRLLMLLPEASS